MAKLLKLRRGTTTQHGSFTGAEGEVTVDTDKDTLVVHDGSTAGGHPVAAEDMANVSSASIAGRLANDSIATSKIAAGALPSDVTVASANIVNGTIATADIGGDQITSALIADDQIDSEHIAAGAVDLEHMSSQSVDEDNLYISNAGTNGQYLQKQSGNNGGLTWATVDLTTLSASNLTSGTIPDARFPSTLPAVSGANLTGIQPFASGTKMIFQQTSAPTGWTKVTSDVDNRALRVVSGTVGSGGSNAFTNTLASRGITANAGNTTQGGNISVSVGNATAGGNISVGNTAAGGNVSVSIANTSTSGTVNSHTLSTSEMPSHSHSGGFYGTAGTNSHASGWGNHPKKGVNQDTGNAGGGGGHSHGFSGGSHSHNANVSFSGSNHNHNASFSGDAHNHNASGNFSGSAHNHSISVTNLDLAVQYIDVIVASKD